MASEIVHKPVLLQQVIDFLKIDPSGIYIDCTLGDGSYSLAIHEKLTTGRLLSLDCDSVAVNFVREKCAQQLAKGNWEVVRANFAELSEVAAKRSFENARGIVFDLGISSRQIDADPLNRGFSYLEENAPLDMRLDDRLGVTAEDLVKALGESELEELFRKLSEERYAKRIAKEIKRYVKANPEDEVTTSTLVDLIRRVVPANYRRGSKHPAMRVFQALRIAVNSELENLRAGLASALSIIDTGGRVVVVSFHSLEDRIVKQMFRESVETGNYKLVNDKPVTPDEDEVRENPRSRSAKLRAIERIK